MAKIGKRSKALNASYDANIVHKIEDAINLVKTSANAKFDETIEVSVLLGVDAKKSDQVVRGTSALPHGTGKTVRVAVFARDAKAEEAKNAGADIVGAEDLVEAILGGTINFDRCIATPDMMAMVGRVAKVLGPKGLMPNPKLGTVTPNVADAVKAVKAGEIQFRIDKAGIVHAGVGKASFASTSIIENIKYLIKSIEKAKPESSKGVFIRNVSISSTMGIGVKVEPASVIA